MWSWYKFARKHPHVNRKCTSQMRIMLEMETMSEDYRHIKYCECRPDQINDVPHLLFEYKHNEKDRILLWNKVKLCTPIPLIECLEMLSKTDRTIFILSGLELM